MGNQQGKQRAHYGRYVDWERAERPSSPGKPYLAPDSADLPDLIKILWAPPMSDGGAPIIGYLVEHRRTGSPHWLRAVPHLAEETELLLTGLEPGWRYQFRVSAENDIGRSDPSEISEPLTVLLQRSAACAPHFNLELHDVVALENETVELKVHILGTPAPQISWFKDGFELFSSRRTKIVIENETSSLIIYQAAVEDEGEIKCTATNRAGHAVTKGNLRLQAPPRIRLPRQYEEGLIFERGEVMRLKVTTAGRPPPLVSWFHNGDRLSTGGRVEVTETEHGSCVRVRDACRDDRGEYSVHGSNYIGEDVVSFLVTITDRPGSPSQPQVVMTLGRSVTLSWSAPDDDGGCRIGNYIVEYFRLGWDMWLKAATSRQLTAQLADLIEGSQYKFRVKAENPYGVSDPSPDSDVVFIADTKRGVLTPPPTNPHQAWMAAVEEDSRKRLIVEDSESDAAKRRKRLEENARRLLDQNPTNDSLSDTGADTVASERRRLLDENARRLLDTPLDVLLAAPPQLMSSVEKPPRRKRRDSRSPSLSPSLSDPSTPPVPKRRAKKNIEDPSGIPQICALPVAPASPRGGRIPSASITHGTPKSLDAAATTVGEATFSRFQESASLPRSIYSAVSPQHSPLLSPPKSPLPLREDSVTHGSSELMLLLYPDEMKPRGLPLTPQHRSEIELSLLEPAVPPPLSLSAPELGSDELYEMPPIRYAVSSTELLHERAMARLYQDAAEEEMLKVQMRRKSLERRPSLRENALERRSSLREICLERRHSFKKEKKPLDLETPKNVSEMHHVVVNTVGKTNITGGTEKAENREKPTDEEVTKMKTPIQSDEKTPKGRLQRMNSEEMEQLEFAKLRERLRLKNEANLKPPEPRVRPPTLRQESNMSSQLSSFDGETGSDHYEGEDESGDEKDYVEDEEEEDLEEEEEEELVEEFMQRLREEVRESKQLKGSLSLDAKPPVPLHGILKKDSGDIGENIRETKKSAEEDTYHPRNMVPTRSEIREIPVVPKSSDAVSIPKITLNEETEERPSSSNENILVETKGPNKAEAPTPVKRKNKLLSKIGFGRKKDTKEATEKSATDVAIQIKSLVALPKPILKKKSIKKKDRKEKTSAESESPSPERVTEKKQVRISEPGTGGLGVPTTDDPKLSPLTKARNQRLQRRQQSLDEEEQANKVFIYHYSDIVKEFGAPKKPPPKLYLELEELEAHASDVPEPVISAVDDQVPGETVLSGSDQEERGSAPDMSEVDTDLGSLVDVAEFIEPPDYEPPEEPQDNNRTDEISIPASSVNEPLSEETPQERPHSPSPTPSRSSNPDEAVRFTMDYLIDVVIVLFAFWLYLFKSELYVIPLLVLLVYRHLQQAMSRKYAAARRAVAGKIPQSVKNKLSRIDEARDDERQ